jgi:hypothetical protein
MTMNEEFRTKKSNGSANGSVNGSSSSSMAIVLPKSDSDGQRLRYNDGWRAGKPTEDPEKTKKWGWISARPSEFLIHMRRGKLMPSSGQGASCFKWPGDSVAIVPTTIQKLRFMADQVTNEKVGVEVTGLAVYRIAEPMIAFRMLNLRWNSIAGSHSAAIPGSVRPRRCFSAPIFRSRACMATGSSLAQPRCGSSGAAATG